MREVLDGGMELYYNHIKYQKGATDMTSQYYAANRKRFYEKMEPGSLLVLFSGEEIRKTSDEFYPFFAERNFVYMTGLGCKQAVLLAAKDGEGAVSERLYILPPDFLAERWTGRRVKPREAEMISGVKDIRFADCFDADIKGLLRSGNYGKNLQKI